MTLVYECLTVSLQPKTSYRPLCKNFDHGYARTVNNSCYREILILLLFNGSTGCCLLWATRMQNGCVPQLCQFITTSSLCSLIPEVVPHPVASLPSSALCLCKIFEREIFSDGNARPTPFEIFLRE